MCLIDPWQPNFRTTCRGHAYKQTTSWTLLRVLCRFGKDQPQGSFFSTREVSSIEKLDVGRELAHNIFDGKFCDISVDGIETLVLNVDRNAELFSDLQQNYGQRLLLRFDRQRVVFVMHPQ